MKKSPKTEVKKYQPNWNPMPSQEHLDKLTEARKKIGINSKIASPRF